MKNYGEMTAISLVTDTILSPIGAYIAIVSMYSLFCILSILHRLRSRVTAENFLCGPKPVRFPSSSFIDMIDFFCSIDIFFHFMRNNSHIWSQTLYVYVWSKNSILSFAGRDKCPSCRWLRTSMTTIFARGLYETTMFGFLYDSTT